ncbi:MAG: HAMP domain-containing protein [Deltaproteobacteria bacterium]|nr:HAMP domain-containing protein [Deltaproteobacteria bacterium]
MGLELRAFRTRVARRIFVLFIVCAIVPISALALVSYVHVRAQLLEQCKVRLRQESKAVAVSLYERLWLVRAEIRMVATNLAANPNEAAHFIPEGITDSLKERFIAAVLIRGEQTPIALLGMLKDAPELASPDRHHLQSGKTLLVCRKGPNLSSRVFMLVALNPGHLDQGLLLAEINPSYLWEAAEGLPSGAEICVMDRKNSVFYTSIPQLISHPAQWFSGITLAHSGHFEWTHNEITYFSSYWTLFLEPNFLYPEWIILVSESARDVFAPMAKFEKAFLVIAILSLGMVFFLSFHLIRRNLASIGILRDATRKIADGIFGHRVEIKSGDEFEGLAASFNDMSAKIKQGQDLLVKAAKLGTMGQMAAGIMHEVKQPLTAIHGLLQLAMMDRPSGEGRKRLETAMQAVVRLNSILTRFKLFSRMSEEMMQTVSVREILDQVLGLLEHQLTMAQVRCEVTHEENLPPVQGDPQSLQQVFSNLLINAADALENNKDKQRLVQVRTYSEEGKVLVQVQDNGCGIPREIQKTIFDPFFTTKPPEKGTGLGMAIIESILDKHKAAIHLESEVGTGTTFTLVFPALDSSETPETDPAHQNGGKEST